MFNLLDSVNPKKLGAKIVLFDSWFAFPAILSKIVKNYSLHVVCMIKRSPKIHYTYEGETMTIMEILGSTIAEEYLLTDEQINNFFDRFFGKLPDYLRNPLFQIGRA